ncbi:hypothetical protein EAH72_14640 [Pseudomonas caspiana]|nr:hypothetical protein EAH72_14640 [Pseudomonas caspiana]
MWERACSRIRSDIQHRCCLSHRLREQARSHNFFALIFIFRSCGAVRLSGAMPGHSRTETDCAPVP